MSGYLRFPYQIDSAGQTATTDISDYVQALILLVLETNPGERVNRPDFGAGLRSLVFEGMDSALASSAQTLVRSKLLQFVGDAITIHTLTVTIEQEAVKVAVTYFVTHTQELASTTVTMPLSGPGAATAQSGVSAARAGSG